MNTPAFKSREPKAIEFFCRHLVALCITFRLTRSEAEQQPEFRAYAGTLICIRNSIFFLTAGHIIRELEEARESDKVVIQSAVLADTFGWRRICDHPIPFDLKSARLFYIDDDEAALDFGLILLEPCYVRLLAANGVVALEEKNWIYQSTVTFDNYMMLGLPEEFTSSRVSDSGNGFVSPAMFSVRRLGSIPGGTPEACHSRFVGKIDRTLALKSVKGMSGGPIFGFSIGPQIRYWVVALQSSWLPDQRIVFGCPLPVLASLLTEGQ